MKNIIINGGVPLEGTINISGSKNATLPLMASALLTDEEVIFCNLPYLLDITTMSQLLLNHGVKLTFINVDDILKLSVKAQNIDNLIAPHKIVSNMRASILVLGPLLARFGKAKVSLPGGCAIGLRPVDIHIKALEAMGAIISIDQGYINATAPNGLTGTEITFSKISVGATENIAMAGTLAKGTTILNNCAIEPEVTFLMNSLVKMGANIKGIGTRTLTITGVEKLHGSSIDIIKDRIELGSYVIATAMTKGKVFFPNVKLELLGDCYDILQQAGIHLEPVNNGLEVYASSNKFNTIDIKTEVYPGIPTDMQAQLMTLMTIANGDSKICESIFENRFMHVPELNRMGANIEIHNNTAHIKGVNNLIGTEVKATDLRASISLVIAGLVAKGKTIIHNTHHIDRGYDSFIEKLRNCNANISR